MNILLGFLILHMHWASAVTNVCQDEFIVCLDKLATLSGVTRPSEHPDLLKNPATVCERLVDRFSSERNSFLSVCGPWFPSLTQVQKLDKAGIRLSNATKTDKKKFIPQAVDGQCPGTTPVSYPVNADAYAIVAGTMGHSMTGVYQQNGAAHDIAASFVGIDQRADPEAVAELLVTLSLFNTPSQCDDAVLSASFCSVVLKTKKYTLGALQILYQFIQFHNQVVGGAEVRATLDNTVNMRKDLCAKTDLVMTTVTDGVTSVNTHVDAKVDALTAFITTKTADLLDSINQVLSQKFDDLTAQISAIETKFAKIERAISRLESGQSSEYAALKTIKLLLLTPEGARPGYGDGCTPDSCPVPDTEGQCTSSAIEHSNFAWGVSGASPAMFTVVCDDGYEGGGSVSCQPNGTFTTLTPCTEIGAQ